MVMAVFAKRLPVALIPEKNGISSMRDDVIDNGCRRQLPVFSALDAKRIFSQKQRSG